MVNRIVENRKFWVAELPGDPKAHNWENNLSKGSKLAFSVCLLFSCFSNTTEILIEVPQNWNGDS